MLIWPTGWSWPADRRGLPSEHSTTRGAEALAGLGTLWGLARAPTPPMAAATRERPPMVTIRTPDRQQLQEAAAARGSTVAGLIRDALAAQGVLIRAS